MNGSGTTYQAFLDLADAAEKKGGTIGDRTVRLVKSGDGGKMGAEFLHFTFGAFGRSFTIDWIALYWIGMALLSVLCALSVWRVKRQ